MAIEFAAGQLASLSMSCASYLGSGHRIEFYGEDGTLVLDNPGGDYMRGFRLFYGKRPAAALTPFRSMTRSTRNIRTAASRRFRGSPGASSTLSKAAPPVRPDFAAGYRVQQLIDAAQRSHQQGVAIDVALAAADEERRR